MENRKSEQIKDFLADLTLKKDGPDRQIKKIKCKVRRDFVGRDQHHEINHIHAITSRPLTKDERRTLNKLAKKLTEVYGELEQPTWPPIHQLFGVDDNQAMHFDHYKPAEAILELRIMNAELRCDTSVEDNDTALRFLLKQANNTIQAQNSFNAELKAQFNNERNTNFRLAVKMNEQTAELQDTKIKLQHALDKLLQVRSTCPRCNLETETELISPQRKRSLLS